MSFRSMQDGIALAFRHHEKQALTLALRFPLFAMFALGYVVLPWFFISAVPLIAGAVIMVFWGGHLPYLYFAVIAALALLGLAFVTIWSAWMFPQYFVHLKLMFGRRTAAENRLEWVTSEIERLQNV